MKIYIEDQICVLNKRYPKEIMEEVLFIVNKALTNVKMKIEVIGMHT